MVLAVVGGIGLGVVMAAVAAARRADGASTRLRAATLAPDAAYGVISRGGGSARARAHDRACTCRDPNAAAGRHARR